MFNLGIKKYNLLKCPRQFSFSMEPYFCTINNYIKLPNDKIMPKKP